MYIYIYQAYCGMGVSILRWLDGSANPLDPTLAYNVTKLTWLPRHRLACHGLIGWKIAVTLRLERCCWLGCQCHLKVMPMSHQEAAELRSRFRAMHTS